MALKDILVQLDASDQSGARLDVAVGLAQRHDAHLTGLHVFDFLNDEPLLYADAGGLAVLVDRIRDESLTRAEAVEQGFRERLRRDGIAGEWRLVEGRAAETVAQHARYADLCVLGQMNPDDPRPSGRGRVVEQTLFAAGRPVLIVPYAGRFASVGRNVLIAWNASREAARAVADALPLIAAADRATVLAIDPPGGVRGHGGEPSADMALHLARHGLNVTAAHTVAGEVGTGDVLLNFASDMGADLLVSGAYGHSRARELVMGGVTRTLLRRMTLPVMMSH